MRIGEWTFTRTILDTYSATTRVANGMLTISSDTWLEKGTMNTHGLSDTHSFSQQYTLSHTNGLRVYFLDGRLFYYLKNPHRNTNIEHLCGHDVYRGVWAYDTITNTLALTWNVTGPRKNYTMHSHYIYAS